MGLVRQLSPIPSVMGTLHLPHVQLLPGPELGWVSPVLVLVSVTKLYLTLCDPLDCRLSGSSVHEISQARILEWVAISFSRDLPNLGIELMYPAFAGRFFTTEPPEKPSKFDRYCQIALHRDLLIYTSISNVQKTYFSNNLTKSTSKV